MKKKLMAALIAGLLAVATVLPASAHLAGPCNDSDGDGSPSGREYAAHHISAFAKAGLLGGDGHIPGSHQGFSVCNPSGK